MSFSRRSAFSFFLSALVSSSASAAPQIAHFVPHALVPGKRTLLTFSGSNLDSATNLWTSFGGKAVRMANTNSGLVSFSVDCPPGVTDIQALQLVGPAGASDFELVMVDALKTEPHHDNHQKPEAAHKISPPSAVDCILKSEQIDYYEFSAKSGEKFSIEVIAHRIGSQMDPVCQVFDSEGHELAFCDDEPGVWKDARFEFIAPAGGNYTIAVHDTAFGGGTAYDYRLRVTKEPLVWFTFPLNDQAEPAVPFEQVGSASPAPASGSPANPFPAPLFGTLPQVIEREPNDTIQNASDAGSPMILHGRISQSSDVDYFRFHASKDQKLIFQSQTRSLGSPCDLVLRLRKPDGTLIAESDMSSANDAALTNKFADDGQLFLEARELSGNSTPNVPYRITVREFTPGFEASAAENILNLKSGESAKVKITAVRHDYTGPIELQFERDLPGLTLESKVIP
jgi:hypothetical protein